MATELELAYDHCGRIARSEAKNFYYAFRTLPSEKRRAIYAVYAFCRLCDDAADEERPTDDKRNLLEDIRLKLEQSRNGGAPGPVFTALNDAVDTFGIPARHLEAVIDGVETDLMQSRYKSFEDLKRYCYGVASAVGLVCIEVFGYTDPRATEYAVDLGLAMQLTNIMRDLKEDAERGRIYIPLDELESFGYTEDELMAGETNGAFKSLMGFQVERARRYFESGRRLLPLLPARSRACPSVLVGFYSAILDKIEASGFDVYGRRVRLSSAEKLLLLARLWATSLISATPLQRR